MHLDDARTDRFPWMEETASLVHGNRMIKQPDMSKDCAKAVVSMWQIVLQRDSAFQFRNSLEMLEVF